MKRYSPERKEAVLQKLLPPYNMTVPALAQEEGISEATLYNWRKQARAEGKPVPGSGKSAEQWSPESKFAVVVETASFSEAELSQYCREKGLYPEQVRQWKQDFIQGAQAAPKRRQQEKAQSNVITSYSIHYTKLYEDMASPKPPGP